MYVLIFNAAAHCPSMHALFTNYAVKHYYYLRDTMPHLVPRLKPALLLSSTGRLDEKYKDDELEDENAKKFLEKMVTAVENSRPGGRVYNQLLEVAAEDLDRLAEMDLRMEGVARFTALYLRCLLLLGSISKEFIMSPNSVTSDSSSNVKSKITLLHKYSQQ